MGDVDERIELVEYDERWPELFREEAALVRAAIGSEAVSVEHTGSTAVPGLLGKPVVDLLVGVASLDAGRKAAVRLATLGYEDFGEIFLPGRLYLRSRRRAQHFNVAIAPVDSPFFATQIAVRDYLRAHPAEAAAYAEEKKKVHAAGGRLFSTYSQGKGAFVEALLERARAWKLAAP